MRKLLGAGGLAALLTLGIVGEGLAQQYDQYGRPMCSTTTTTGAHTSTTMHPCPTTSTTTVYTTGTAYVPRTQVYGAMGVRGQARRVSRRTSRRVSARN